MILLTGASGFIGKHLLSTLIKIYGSENILALTSKPTNECKFLFHNGYTFDQDYFVKSGFDSIKTIIHAGAFIPKAGHQANDWLSCNSNISGTAKLLGAHFPSLEKIIYLSTVDVYGDDHIISEKSPLIPVSLYGDSKLYCEKLISTWAEYNNKIHQILRIGHVYGPGEEEYQKIIPVTIRKILDDESVQIWGTGEDVRSFININDIVSAIIGSLTLKESIGPVNLVSNQRVTIKEIVQKIIKLSGRNATIEMVSAQGKGRNLIFDNAKMRMFLIDSEIPLEQGLTEELEYMREKFR